MQLDGPLTVTFEAAEGNSLHLVGGKGASLAKLVAAGSPVPPGFTVTTLAYRQTLGSDLLAAIAAPLAGLDAKDTGSLEARAAAIRERIRALPLPAAVEAGIRDGYAGICARFGAELPVAVRFLASSLIPEIFRRKPVSIQNADWVRTANWNNIPEPIGFMEPSLVTSTARSVQPRSFECRARPLEDAPALRQPLRAHFRR